jgi:hypothetical protein
MIRVAHTRILKKYDDTIGDPKLPSRGFTWAALLLDRINFQKVEKMKKEQVRIYEKYLADLTQPFYRIIIPASDYGKLHAYPLGFSGPPDESLIRYLHARGIVVWFKFTDAPWSKRRGVLYLPLGFHIGETHIAYIAGYIRAWVGSPA